MEGEYCEGLRRSNRTNFADVKQECYQRSDCNMITDLCGRGNDFWYCSRDSKVLPSTCGSTLYTPGKHLTFENLKL